MKRKLLPLFAASLMVLFTACSSDSSHSDEPTVNEPLSLTLKIAQSDFTRAESSDIIKSLNVVYVKGKKLTSAVITPVEGKTGEYTVEYTGDITDLPDGILVYANTTVENVALTSEVDELGDETDGFVMSNVGTVDGNTLKNYIPLSINNFVEGAEAITVNLERACAQVTVSKNNEDISYANLPEGISFKLDGWHLSAIDQSTYLFKQLSITDNLGNWWKPAGTDVLTHWANSVNHSSIENIKYANNNETANGFGTTIYAHESTRSSELHETLNALPSIVITGTYTKSGVAEGTTLYRLADESFVTADKYFELIKSSKIFGDKTADDIKEIVTLDSHEANEPANVVTPQLTDKYTEEDKEDLNNMLGKVFGAAEKYFEGKCYFIVPIKHKNYDSKKTERADQPEGAFGLVRNHLYTLTLNGLSGVGYGVAAKGSKYLEYSYNASKPQFSVNLSITVADWCKVDTQEIN